HIPQMNRRLLPFVAQGGSQQGPVRGQGDRLDGAVRPLLCLEDPAQLSRPALPDADHMVEAPGVEPAASWRECQGGDDIRVPGGGPSASLVTVALEDELLPARRQVPGPDGVVPATAEQRPPIRGEYQGFDATTGMPAQRPSQFAVHRVPDPNDTG